MAVEPKAGHREVEVLAVTTRAAGSFWSMWIPTATQIPTAPQPIVTSTTQGTVTIASSGGVPTEATLQGAAFALWDTSFTTAPGAMTVAFDFNFTDPGDGNQLGILADGQLRFLSQGNIVGTTRYPAAIDISDLAVGQHKLTFNLYSPGTNASLTVSNFTIAIVPPIVFKNLAKQNNGSFQFGFTHLPNATFYVFAATNLSAPLTNWTLLGTVPEISSGQYKFVDTQNTNLQHRFYGVRSP